MKKKIFTFGLLGLFALALVSAGLISYYGSVEQDINIESPIEASEYIAIELSGILQSPQLGQLITAENIADFDVDVEVVSDVTEGGESSDDIDTNYVNMLTLTKKDTDAWTQIPGDDIEIAYTVVGDDFAYEVVSGSIPSEYELVYAMDKANRFADYATVKTQSEISESLPMTGDANIDEYNYCTETGDNYATCYGAKLWIIPSSDIGENGVLSWENMDDYYYETDLVHYFKTVDGVTTIPAGVSMEFYPQYEFGTIEGDYTVTTEVNPVV